MQHFDEYFLPKRVFQVPIDLVVKHICKVNERIQKFWSQCDGWAPAEAAELLGEVRLDWLTEFSQCLKLWIEDDPHKKSGGHLILARANLGSLIEGSLKLILSVYLENYSSDPQGAKEAGALTENGVPKPPEDLRLQQLKVFCKKKGILNCEEEKLVNLVVGRR